MVDLNDREEAQKFTEGFVHNVSRALNAKLKISKKRAEAITLLCKRKNYSQGMKLLQFCIRNESRLLNVIMKNSDSAFSQLKYCLARSKKIKGIRPIEASTKKLLKMLDFLRWGIKTMNSRIEAEWALASDGDSKTFYSFLQAWKEELEYEKILLSQLSGLSRDYEYYKDKNFGTISSKTNLAAGSFPFAASISGMYFFSDNPAIKEMVYNLIRIGYVDSGDYNEVVVGSSVLLGLSFIIADFINGFIRTHRETYELNVNGFQNAVKTWKEAKRQAQA